MAVENLSTSGQEIRLLSNESPEELLEDLSCIYMVVFGNTPGFNEGGIHPDGSTIPLNTFLNYVILSPHFTSAKPADAALQNIQAQGSHPTNNLVHILKWLERLPPEERMHVYNHIEKESEGYRPYYTLSDVSKRLGKDLLPSPTAHPIIVHWGDAEYPRSGFITGVVFDDFHGLSALIHNAPYLTKTHHNIDEQVTSFFARAPLLKFPVLFEYETAVIPERAGREKGSNWSALLQLFRTKAIAMGAKYAIGFTSQESIYYKSSIKHGNFIYDFPTLPHSGNPLRFYVVDLEKSISHNGTMTDVSVYSALATHILKNQLAVIGPLAIEQVKEIADISVDESNTITIKANGKEVLTQLVKQFERLFGQASVEVCRDAIKEAHVTIPDKDLPDILR